MDRGRGLTRLSLKHLTNDSENKAATDVETEPTYQGVFLGAHSTYSLWVQNSDLI